MTVSNILFMVGGVLAARLDVVLIDTEDIVAAIDLHRLHSFSFWDALVVHAAQVSSAEVLYSEDLSDGQRYGSVRVVNPFLDSTRLPPSA